MTCAMAREQLLEADLDELSGKGSSALALHLRTCARCNALAEHLLREERALDRALWQLSPRRGLEEALQDRKPFRHWWRLAVPLATAAMIALLVAGPWRPPPVAGPPVVAEGVRAPAGISVSASVRKNAVVFKTDDPKVTVIWFF